MTCEGTRQDFSILIHSPSSSKSLHVMRKRARSPSEGQALEQEDLYLVPVAQTALPPPDSEVFEQYNGKREGFTTFKAQCELYMHLRQNDFTDEKTKVGFLIMAQYPILNDAASFLNASKQYLGMGARKEMVVHEIKHFGYFGPFSPTRQFATVNACYHST
uniref:Uncharacterized protein n=1 Tax=Varanus komodoensis TaxID=61221 RepID=A0A8D2KWB5_VARKO